MKIFLNISLYLVCVTLAHMTHGQKKHVIYVNSSSISGLSYFDPGAIYASMGDTVVWVPGIKPIVYHTITTNKFPSGAEPIDFKLQSPSDTIFKYIVKFPGQYNYVCKPHSPYMQGNVWVSEPNGIMPENIKYTEKSNAPQLVPNPAHNSVTFYQLDESVKYTLKIYNELGSLITETSIANVKGYEINIANFDEGIYTAHLAYCGCKPQKNGCGGSGQTLKFVKQ